MIQSTPRRRQGALLLLLAVELALAGWWRWPQTTAAIETGFEYGSGHVAVVSERWARAGAVRQHFLPVMSIDPDLPEWPYRTLYSQEYYSVPPLAFMLHYGAARLFPRVEPVLLAKLVAQALVCASVLASSALFASVFDAWSIAIGLSFLISGVPFLLWFANGYFAVNVGLAVQLVLAAWCARAAVRSLDAASAVAAPGAGYAACGGFLAFLGAFADYMPLAANAAAFVGLVLLALAARGRPASRRFAWQAAAAVAIGSAAAVATTFVLYGRQMGVDRYRDALTERVAQRSGDASVVEHVDVIRHQMLTAWPPLLLAALCAALLVVTAWCAVAVARKRADGPEPYPLAILFAIAVSAIPSLGFHYLAVNYVRIHWWFAGTWTIVLAVGLCAFVDLLRRRFAPARLDVLCAAALLLVVVVNVRFTSAQTVVNAAHLDTVRVYRDLGRALPHDGLPLIVTDVTTESPGLFEDFPYATAYLRRPVLLRDRDGSIRLPVMHEIYDGRPLTMGGEIVSEKLFNRGGDVYIAYDPDARRCLGAPVPGAAVSGVVSIAVCRAPAQLVARTPSQVLGPLNPDYECSAPPAPPRNLHVASNQGGTVTVAWSASATPRAAYVLEVGRTPGASGALVASTGRETAFTARSVQAGTYFVRVRGRNVCGAGAPSGELTVVVE